VSSATGAVGRAALAHLVDRGVQPLRRDGAGRQRILGAGVHQRQRGQQPLDRNEAVAGLLGDLPSASSSTRTSWGRYRSAVAARHLGQLGDGGVDRLVHPFGRTAGLADQVRGQPLIIIHQGLEQMIGQHALVAFAHRDGLGRLKEAARPFRELFQVHRSLLF
jgi:hypothetical protein